MIYLVAHQAAIGDTIVAIGPYGAIASRGQLGCDAPSNPYGSPFFGWICPELRGIA